MGFRKKPLKEEDVTKQVNHKPKKMAEETVAAPAPAAPAPASPVKKAAKPKAAKPKAPAAHPTYKDMAIGAITGLKDRSGSSRQAILKYVMANYKVGTDASKVSRQLQLALKKAVAGGALKAAAPAGRKGAGSYRLGEKPKAEKKKKPAKPAAKKAPAKKKSPKKAAAKKPAAKKSPAKKAATKPAAKKAPVKKAASPKKAPAKKSPKKAAKA